MKILAQRHFAVWKVEEDMPLFVIIDCEGNNLYEMGRKEYLGSA